ncbi:MAG: triphosphoribosyl-dephospho-CoA synthase [Candidatus Izemoplasmatales bacterium]
MSSILDAREERGILIHQLLQKSPIVISVKANIPGPDKNLVVAHLIVSLFTNLIHHLYKKEPVKYLSEDGPFSVFGLEDEGSLVKSQMIDMEETHPIGRYVDIDVYSLQTEFHRDQPRKCYLCGDVAFHCAKANKHSLNEYINQINDDVSRYLMAKINQFIDESMLDELHLHPKFGLVTKDSPGSHKDMNYQMMVTAKNAIIPFLVKIYEYAFHSEEPIQFELFHIKAIGMAAEKAMYESTNHVNAYKGLIYHLGYGLFALGKVMKLHQSFDEIFEWLKNIGTDYEKNMKQAPDSYGKQLFLDKGIGGARKEMAMGLPHVHEAMSYLVDNSRQSLYNALRYLIIHVEDTTLYKRAGFAQVQSIKNKFIDLDVTDEEAISRLTNECIESQLTFGGSADLLVVSLFFNRIKAWIF